MEDLPTQTQVTAQEDTTGTHTSTTMAGTAVPPHSLLVDDPVEDCWENEPQHGAAARPHQGHQRGEVWDANDN